MTLWIQGAVNLQVRKKPTLVILQGECGESLFMQQSEPEKARCNVTPMNGCRVLRVEVATTA